MGTLGRFLLRYVAPFTVLLVSLGLATTSRPPSQTTEAVFVPVDLEGDSVHVIHPTSYRGPVCIDAYGVAEPSREVELSSEVSGKIVAVHASFKTGCTVREGDVLLQIDPRSYQLDAQLLEASIRQAEIDRQRTLQELEIVKERIAIAEAQVELLRTEYLRSARVARSNALSKSKVDLDHERWLQSRQALCDLRSRTAMLQSGARRASIELERCELKLKKAHLTLEQATIRAPFDALVVQTNVEIGASINPGEPLVTIQDTQSVEVACSLTSDDLNRLFCGSRIGQSRADFRKLPKLPVTISHVQGEREHTWGGWLSRCEGHGFDEKTRTLPCRVVVDQPTSESGLPLRRGLFVSVAIHLPAQESMYSIPTHALQAADEVWLLSNGQLECLPVDVVALTSEYAVVRQCKGREKSISETSQVVVSPLQYPYRGAPIGGSELVSWSGPYSADPTHALTRIHRQMGDRQ